MAKLFIGNLSWNATEGDLESFFGTHGVVTEAKIVYDRDTNRSRGFGFVTYEEGVDLDAVIRATDGALVAGREIRVSVAEERPRRTPRENDNYRGDRGQRR